MEQYIDKSAVVAEIEKRIKNYILLQQKPEMSDLQEELQNKIDCLNSIKGYILNNLEVKEVDLEKELQSFFYPHVPWGDYCKNEQKDIEEWSFKIAKHFFELGIEKSINESLIRKIVDLNNEAAKHYDAIMKKERNENGFSQLAIDLLDHNVDANELRIQYIIENLKAQKGE